MTSVTPLNFGSYRPFAINHTDSAASIILNCSGTSTSVVPYEIRLSPGQSGNVYIRNLTGGSDQDELAYQLYLDPGHSIIWGDGISGTSASGVISLTTPSGIATENIYGRINKQQIVRGGRYSDIIIVSIIL